MKRLALALCLALGFPAARAEAENLERIELTPAQAEAFAVVPADRAEEAASATACGVVLDPVPYVQAWVALDVARDAAEIAEREGRRVEALARADHDASARDVEAARLAVVRSSAEQVSAEAVARALWGDALREAGTLAKRLANSEVSIARVDLPSGAPAIPQPTGVAIAAPGLGIASRPARLLGPAPSVDPTAQGAGFLVLLDGALATGAALEARLALGFSIRGAWLPDTAIVWDGAESAVFVPDGIDGFRRQTVRLTPSSRPRFWIAEDLAPGTAVVRLGAQQLLSALRLSATAED